MKALATSQANELTNAVDYIMMIHSVKHATIFRLVRELSFMSNSIQPTQSSFEIAKKELE